VRAEEIVDVIGCYSWRNNGPLVPSVKLGVRVTTGSEIRARPRGSSLRPPKSAKLRTSKFPHRVVLNPNTAPSLSPHEHSHTSSSSSSSSSPQNCSVASRRTSARSSSPHHAPNGIGQRRANSVVERTAETAAARPQFPRSHRFGLGYRATQHRHNAPHLAATLLCGAPSTWDNRPTESSSPPAGGDSGPAPGRAPAAPELPPPHIGMLKMVCRRGAVACGRLQ